MHAHATTDDTAQKTKGTRTWNIGDCVAASYLVMHLFSQERLKSRGITAAVYGNFFAPKQQELGCLVARGPRQSALELIRPDDHGKVPRRCKTVHATEAIGMAS